MVYPKALPTASLLGYVWPRVPACVCMGGGLSGWVEVTQSLLSQALPCPLAQKGSPMSEFILNVLGRLL